MQENKISAKLVVSEIIRAIKLVLRELKPRGPVITPYNVITGAIILVGLGVVVVRMFKGLAAIGHTSQEYPWGLWIGFNVIVGVAFAAGAYVMTFVVYILNNDKYKPIIRTTVLNGLLAYMFYAGALLLDVGRPWSAPNPLLGREFGVSSILFLVAWHFMLYMVCEALEFAPVVAQWLGWERIRKWIHGLTLGAVIFGITLSTLHQSGLGALFLMAKSKVHPLWYSSNIGMLFFVSSVFAGLSLVIIEGTFTNRIFAARASEARLKSFEGIVLGLGKGAAAVMFAYLFLKVLDMVHNHNLSHLSSGWGAWYLVEMVGFVVLPMMLFAKGVRGRSVRTVQVAAFIAAFGIILNRLNVVLITYKWYSPERFQPHWQEVVVTLMIICIHFWVFRWVINRMPVMGDKMVAGQGAGQAIQ